MAVEEIVKLAETLPEEVKSELARKWLDGENGSTEKYKPGPPAGWDEPLDLEKYRITEEQLQPLVELFKDEPLDELLALLTK